MAPSILKEFPGSLKRLQVYLEVVHGIHDGLTGLYVKVPGIRKGRLSWEDSSCPWGISRFFFNKLYGVCCPTMQHSQSKNGSGGGGGVHS